MGSAFAIKLMVAACLIVAVSQLQFSYAANTRVSQSAKDNVSENSTNEVNKDQASDTRPKRGPNYRRATEEESQKNDWKPNTTPSHFHFKLTDKIKGADQFREEKVNNGEVTGYWAVPTEDGKMLKRTEYRAGKDGFHIVSEKLVPRDEMMGDTKTNPDEANVEIDQLGGNTAYTVKASDLKKSQPIKRAPAGMY